MLDINKRREFISSETTVGDLIEVLKEFDPNTPFGVDGNNVFYLHVDVNDDGDVKAISLDYSDLDEYYNDIRPRDDIAT